MASLEKQKSKLENTKRRLKDQEKLIKVKEKRLSQNQLNNLGKLFLKARISHLDPELLLGALIDISEKSKDEKNISSWEEKSQQHRDTEKKGNAIIISFKTPPEIKLREKLKELNFRWNSFRGEYYGFGNKNAVSNLLKDSDCKIEMFE